MRKLLEVEQECIAEGEAREKYYMKKEPLKNFTVKGLAEAFTDLDNILKKFKNIDTRNKIVSLIENIHSI